MVVGTVPGMDVSFGMSSLGADSNGLGAAVGEGGLDTRGCFDLGSAVSSRACSAALVPSEGAEAACTSPVLCLTRVWSHVLLQVRTWELKT